MLSFAANLSMLFTEYPFMDRFRAAAEAGFRAVEYPFPYDYDKEQLAEALARHGLVQALHNLPAGHWQAGERGLACDPARRGEFQDGVALAMGYAKALGCLQVNCLAGIPPVALSEEVKRETLVGNLRFAAAALKQEGIRLLIEPINPFDMPGFYVNSVAQAAELLDATGSDHLFILMDLYHAQRTHGELTGTLTRYFDRIKHIQIADNPGRHEPGTGEINYPWLFDQLEVLGYQGWVGCEYRPKHGTLAGLGWMRTSGGKAVG